MSSFPESSILFRAIFDEDDTLATHIAYADYSMIGCVEHQEALLADIPF